MFFSMFVAACGTQGRNPVMSNRLAEKDYVRVIHAWSEGHQEDAEILVVNKADLIKPIEYPIIEASVNQLNPKAKVIKLSKADDESFKNFVDIVLSDSTFCFDNSVPLSPEDADSIGCSGVATYASEFSILDDINAEIANSMAENLINSVKDSVVKLNPEFIGHIKVVLEHGSGVVKASITAHYESPQMENIGFDVIKEPNLKILSAVSNISKDELVSIVNSCVEDAFLKKGIESKKITNVSKPLAMEIS